MADELADPIAHHLEFLGYQTTTGPDGWCCSEHSRRFNLFYRRFPFGWRFHVTVYLGKSLHGIRETLLEGLNAANEKSAVVKFTLNRDADGDYGVRARAHFNGTYDRTDFGAFMEVWHSDLELVSDLPQLPEAEEGDGEKGEEEAAEAVVN